MTTQSANTNNHLENDDDLQEKVQTETKAEEVNEEELAQQFWDEFTGKKEPEDSSTDDPDDIGAEEETVQPKDQDEDKGNVTDSQAVEPSSEDSAKLNKALDQIEQTKGGNKNYIDHDLLNSIEDPNLRQKVWALANTAQSHYGRLYQREQELNKLRNQLAQVEAEREVAKQQATTKAQESQIDKDTEDKVHRLKRDYPDLSDSIEALFRTELDKRQKEINELFDKNIVPLQQKMENEARQTEIQRLEEAANEIFQTETTGISYKEVVKSPDFDAWLSSQDESIRKLANSDRAAEVALVLKTFESDYSRQYKQVYGKSWIEAVTEGQVSADKANATNTSTDPDLSKRAEAIRQKRETRKRAAVTGVAPSRQPTSNEASADAEAYFNHFAKQSRYAR